MSEILVLLAIVLVASTGLPGLFFGRTSMHGQWLATVTAVLGSALLVGEWFVATGGRTLVEQMPWPQRTHSVTLTWKASGTKNVRYNVYRGPRSGYHPDKLNDTPIDGMTFTDTKVESGKQYFYVTRAVDGHNQESGDSSETSATIP